MNTYFLRNIITSVCLGCFPSWLALAQSTYEPYTITTITGMAGIAGSADGINDAAGFNWPIALTMDSAGNLYVADSQNHTIRKVAPEGTNWVVTTLAGTAGLAGSADGANSDAGFNTPIGVAVDRAGILYVADSGNDTIRKMTPVGSDWVVTTLAGMAGMAGSADGTNDTARFSFSNGNNGGLTVDSSTNLFVADWGNHTIRKVMPVGTNWVVTTLAGKAGAAGSANGTNRASRFNGPMGVAVDGIGNVYVADQMNYTIRKVTPVGTNWVVTTLAGMAGFYGSADGTSTGARFCWPVSVTVDGAGNLYVADALNNSLRKVTPVGTHWVVTTLAGKAGVVGCADGTGSGAGFDLGHFDSSVGYFGGGVAVDSAGNLYVADVFNNVIRKGFRPLAITSAGATFGFNGGKYGFRLTGPAGQAVVVDASTDLLNWAPVWTNTFMVNPLQFSDPDSGVYPHRFYRAQISVR